MKPIIIDMKDLSDSVEVYESKPNPFLIYTIYAILAVVGVAIIWASFFKIDDEVKSDGMFKGTDAIYEISSGVSGKIISSNVRSGDYVSEGDVLYEISIDSLSDMITSYQDSLQDATDRLEMLDAYDKALDSGMDISTEYAENQYYDEFVNRRKLLYESNELASNNSETKSEVYQGTIDTITSTISKYNSKIEKLNDVKSCITNRRNTFDSSDSYYYSMVNSYLSNYNYTKLQYDNTIAGYQSQLTEINTQLEQIENGTASEDVRNSKSALETQKTTLESSITSSQGEQSQALSNLENSQIATVEQLIENYNDSVTSLNSNLQSAELEMNGLSDTSSSETIAILTEKGKIASEELEVEKTKEESENYLKTYNIKNDNCTIVASTTGYYYADQELRDGTYLQEGSSIGSIYPKKEKDFYAELYVDNASIGKLEVGQKVKFEISSFPSSEYGYFTGEVKNIAKTITVDEKSGTAYYIVKVKCDEMERTDADGNAASLKNGMACTGKVIIGEKTVMKYLLEKINILE